MNFKKLRILSTLRFLKFVTQVDYITRYMGVIYANHFTDTLSGKGGRARFLLHKNSACALRKVSNCKCVESNKDLHVNRCAKDCITSGHRLPSMPCMWFADFFCCMEGRRSITLQSVFLILDLIPEKIGSRFSNINCFDSKFCIAK